MMGSIHISQGHARVGICNAWTRVFLVFFAVILSACSNLPKQADLAGGRATLSDFSLSGRFSLRQDDENYSGRLEWKHAGADNKLVLSSPFGQGIAEIRTRADGASLQTSDGTLYTAADAESLTADVLGYVLPLSQLTDWVRGRVAVDGSAELDAEGRPLHVRYPDWSVDYGYGSDDPAALPNRVFVERAGGFELRLRIDEWRRLPVEPAP